MAETMKLYTYFLDRIANRTHCLRLCNHASYQLDYEAQQEKKNKLVRGWCQIFTLTREIWNEWITLLIGMEKEARSRII